MAHQEDEYGHDDVSADHSTGGAEVSGLMTLSPFGWRWPPRRTSGTPTERLATAFWTKVRAPLARMRCDSRE